MIFNQSSHEQLSPLSTTSVKTSAKLALLPTLKVSNSIPGQTGKNPKTLCHQVSCPLKPKLLASAHKLWRGNSSSVTQPLLILSQKYISNWFSLVDIQEHFLSKFVFFRILLKVLGFLSHIENWVYVCVLLIRLELDKFFLLLILLFKIILLLLSYLTSVCKATTLLLFAGILKAWF